MGGGGRPLQKLVASLGSCGLFPGGDRLEPRHDPHPRRGHEGLPSTRGAFTGNGARPVGTEPRLPLGGRSSF